MKLNNIKTGLLLAGLLLLFGNVKAQDNPFKPEWFVSGGINGITALNGSANNILGGKVSGGVWLNKIIGLRVDAEAGNVWLKGGYNAVTVGAGADILVNLMKNYTDENLQQLFDALQKSKFRYRERFLLPYRDGYKTVRVSDINHIETENKIVHLRLNNGTSEVVNVSMDELEHQLNPDYFFRANRQYIINVEHVLFLGNYFGGKLIVRLKGYPKTEIQVSKEKAQRLKEWIDR